MENADIAAKMGEALVKAGGTDKSVKFDFGDDGCVFASGTEATTEDKDADCTISVSKDDFISLAEGNLDPMMAFMLSLIHISGPRDRG